MADYIVAIELGTSHLTGIVGEKNENGMFSIIAHETEDTVSCSQQGEPEEKNTCIYRGIIYNRDDTATHIGNLIKKLETHLKGDYIDKVYVGVSGQSLHTIDHIETMDIAEGVAVTVEDIAALEEKCRKYKPDLLDVLGMAPTVYYLNGLKYTNPVNVLGQGKPLEAHYKIIIGRSSIRQRVVNCIEDINGKSLAGIIVSPLALADAVLSATDKKLGCALVDFGAGVTAVSVYKDGDLQRLCVIPFGGNLITRDITALQLTREEAEKLKIEKGSAMLGNEAENETVKVERDNDIHEIKLSDLNAIIEARTKEIVKNVYARISEVTSLKQLGAGIILAGCASEMADLHGILTECASELTDSQDVIKEKYIVKIRSCTIQEKLVEGADELQGNPLYMAAISVMMKGTESCVSLSLPDDGKEEEDMVEKNESATEKPVDAPVKRERGKWQKVKDMFVVDLFGSVD